MTVMEALVETSIETKLESQVEPDLADTIRLRAYDLYEARNREENHAWDHWLQAEAEIRGGQL